jgi:uncharacterized membrane protein YwzB
LLLKIKYFKVGKISKSLPSILCYSHCAFYYTPHCNQQTAPINAQYNKQQNTFHVSFRMLHISATWCHLQEVKNNKRFLNPKRVVLVTVTVTVRVTVVFVNLAVTVIVAVTVEFSSGLILSFEIRFVSPDQDITNILEV